ncbi:MAG: acyl-CoA thioesterase [Actinomycetota bacterium]|nr:acyl-CoA thioesterase [Rubrobacter sp.]MDQ3509900.1 acyl-CoA thioesterase [Actinomycetota bacterium]
MENPPVVRKLEVRYRDLDTLGHVNNAVFLEYFETVRFEYWWRIAEIIGVTEFVSGDLPGAQYVVAETTVRFKAPVFFGDILFGAATVPTIGNRSYSMDFELRTGESYENGTLVAEGSAAHVFYDPEKNEVMPRPEWLLSAAAKLEGRTEDSFSK